MEINEHLLAGEEIEITQTPNTSGVFKNGLPDTIVVHFTGGSSAQSSVNHLKKRSAKASSHLVIGRDGKVYQLAPFNIITWHAGRSTWKGRHGLNKYSIGIELDNAGELSDNGNGQFISWFNKSYAPEEVFQGTHRNRNKASFWHAYTEVQIAKTFEVCRLLCEQYGISEIVGHEEIAPRRKTDPGPAFPLDRMREQILASQLDSEDAAEPPLEDASQLVVNASKLNIRSGPGAEFGLASEPLPSGSIVKPTQSANGWIEVEYTVKGWVSSQYLKRLS